MKYYKILDADGGPCNGGSGRWHLPRGKRPGKWMPRIDGLRPCERGYHVCRRAQVVRWLGPTIWVCEIAGDTIRQDDKIVTARARLLYQVRGWDEQTQRMFACDCTEHVLALDAYPSDRRPSRVIEAARAFVASVAREAARDAARDAARNARDAARNAVAAYSWVAARDAWAARPGSWAAEDAAREAAWLVEHKWQTSRLFRKYLDAAPP